MATPEASVYPVGSRLFYAFAIYPMNERCSQICSKRIILLTSLSKTLFASYSYNVVEVELPFCERRRMGSNTHAQREGD